MNTAPAITIDGQPHPVDDCIWLQRRPCGCVVAAAFADVDGEGGWTLATAEQAVQHFNPTKRDQELTRIAGLTVEPITSLRYRSEFADHWRCTNHARPA